MVLRSRQLQPHSRVDRVLQLRIGADLVAKHDQKLAIGDPLGGEATLGARLKPAHPPRSIEVSDLSSPGRAHAAGAHDAAQDIENPIGATPCAIDRRPAPTEEPRAMP